MEWLTAAVATLERSIRLTDERLTHITQVIALALYPEGPKTADATAAVPGLAATYAAAHAAVTRALTEAHLRIAEATVAEISELERIKRTNKDLASTPSLFTVERSWFSTVLTGGRMKGAAPLRNTNSVLNYNVEPTADGPDAGVGYRLFPTDISADSLRELPGADHALAAVLCAVAEHDGAALRWMFAPNQAGKKHRLDVYFPGKDAIWVHTAVPRAMKTRPVGITTKDEDHYGFEFLAKAYGIAQNLEVVPYLDPAKSTVAERAKVAMEAVTGNLAFETDPRLYVDDADLVAELGKSQVAVAVTSAIAPATPAYDAAQRCRLITHRPQAYAILGVDDDDRIVVHHPLGHRAALPVADFRRAFPTVLISELPETPALAPTPTDDQLDHLQTLLDMAAEAQRQPR